MKNNFEKIKVLAKNQRFMKDKVKRDHFNVLCQKFAVALKRKISDI